MPITQYCSAQHILALTGREGDDIWDYDVWRLWTYQFAHAGIGHLLPNVLCQIIFGTLLEIVHGPLRVGSLYTIGVIFGGCFSLIVKVKPSSLSYGSHKGILASFELGRRLGRCLRVDNGCPGQYDAQLE